MLRNKHWSRIGWIGVPKRLRSIRVAGGRGRIVQEGHVPSGVGRSSAPREADRVATDDETLHSLDGSLGVDAVGVLDEPTTLSWRNFHVDDGAEGREQRMQMALRGV